MNARACGGDLSGLAAGVQREQLALDLVAAQLARGGARQIVLPDVIGEDALGGRQGRGDALHVVADDLADVDDAVLAQHLEVGDDHAVQALAERLAGLAALQAQDAELLDPRRAQVVGLDLFGIDVFAGAEDDDILGASGDEVVALGVGVGKVAGVEPAVAQHLGGGLGAVVVALHHGGAGDGDLADEVSVLVQLGIDELGLEAGQRTGRWSRSRCRPAACRSSRWWSP